MDKDSRMLNQMGSVLTTLQIKFRNSSVADRITMRPKLEQVTHQYVTYQLSLIEDGIIVTEDDLTEMEELKAEIDGAAQSQQILVAIIKTGVFLAARV